MKNLSPSVVSAFFAVPLVAWAASSPVTFVSPRCANNPSLAGYLDCFMPGNNSILSTENSVRMTVAYPPDMNDCTFYVENPDPNQSADYIFVPLRKWTPASTGIHSGCHPYLPDYVKRTELRHRLTCKGSPAPSWITSLYLNNWADCK